MLRAQVSLLRCAEIHLVHIGLSLRLPLQPEGPMASFLLKASRGLVLSIAIGSALASCQRGGHSFAVAPASGGSESAVKGVAPPLQKFSDDNRLKDDQRREYSLQRIPKNAAHRMNDKTVRSQWGVPLDVVKEDGNFYYYKVYKPIMPPHQAAKD